MPKIKTKIIKQTFGQKTVCFEFFYSSRSIKTAKWDYNTLILHCQSFEMTLVFPEYFVLMSDFKDEFLQNIEEFGNVRFWEVFEPFTQHA